MDIGLQLPPELQEATKTMICEALNEAIKNVQIKNSFPPFLTQQEACKYLHIAPSTFNKWDREYHIPVIRIEGVKRYKKDSLDEFMKKLER
ncbi:helix-turn-helix domain-containing protein [Limosilactobacillus reuteri]|uniref:helix-turn-helix domain-containing protein n=1 Tax=Limosilactobacillus reuteri TaxID=1598 RepID=UPI000A2D25D4|nr:helix-turn-helix domain-containing protein [Limosilactobacillus reuteri]OTA49480.1 hypothetical protein BHL90_07165 [Limosilactobacillus reuteri]